MLRALWCHSLRSTMRILCLGLCAFGAVSISGCGGGGGPEIGGTVVVGEIAQGSTSVTPSSSGVPYATVWLEQQSHMVAVATPVPTSVPTPVATPGPLPPKPVENLIETTTADGDGRFQFNGVPPGPYEIVADAASMPETGSPSAATITTGVQVTASGGPGNLTIPLGASSGAVVINGIFTSANSLDVGTGVNITYAGVQATASLEGIIGWGPVGDIGPNPGPEDAGAPDPIAAGLLFLIPAVGTSGALPPPISTGPSTATCTCPTGTFCACYEIALPGGIPALGAANGSGTGYFLQEEIGPKLFNVPPVYGIDAAATLIGNPTSADCNPSELVSLTSEPGFSVTEIDFTGCQ